MTDDASAFSGFNSYSSWLSYSDEIADYNREMSENLESAKRDYDAQMNTGVIESDGECESDYLFDDD